MRLSCDAHCLGNRALSDALGLIREAGYEAVEVSLPTVERSMSGSRDPVAGLAALLDEHGLGASGIRVSPLDALNAQQAGAAAARLSREMESARRIGLDTVQTAGGDRRVQSMAAFLTALEATMDAADHAEMTIALSNALGTRLEQLNDLRQVFIQMNRPGLAVTIDAGRFHQAAVNPCDAVREFGDKMVSLRLTDRVGKRAVPMGRGETNIAAIVARARRAGYEGWVVVDPDEKDPETALASLRQARTYLQDLMTGGLLG